MRGTIHSIRVAGVLLALLAALACSNPARAQDSVRGKFVLPFSVQWQDRTLPAGEYHFTISSRNIGGLLVIRDTRDRAQMLVVTPQIIDKLPGRSALTVVNRDGQRYVSSLAMKWAECTFVYTIPKQKNGAARELEASVQFIPVQIAGS